MKDIYSYLILIFCIGLIPVLTGYYDTLNINTIFKEPLRFLFGLSPLIGITLGIIIGRKIPKGGRDE